MNPHGRFLVARGPAPEEEIPWGLRSYRLPGYDRRHPQASAGGGTTKPKEITWLLSPSSSCSKLGSTSGIKPGAGIRRCVRTSSVSATGSTSSTCAKPWCRSSWRPSILRNLAANGGTVLFVGTKKQAQGPVAEAAQRAGMPYVNFRWLGGMLTNFTTIQKRIFYMKELERMESSGEINALSKRERLSIRRELDKLQQTLGGVREMTRVPEAIFIVDVNTEHTAVKEAKRLGITTLALVDSNCDPDHIDFVIAGNDDAIRAASTVAGALAEAAREGRELAGRRSFRPRGRKPGMASPGPRTAGNAARCNGPTPEQPAPEQLAPDPHHTRPAEPPVRNQCGRVGTVPDSGH